MASASAGDLGRHLGRLFGAGSAVGLTDGELLERFARRRDEAAEAAFEILLARHAAMVLTVCQQVLGDSHAAEDAFQATFLVVVRRAGSLRVRKPGSVGPWLHGVAYRIALKTRQGAARRRAREHRVAAPTVGRPSAAIEHGELRALLHDEVNRLPAKYRAPVVLCYFEGRTHDEAAAALRWPVGTVRGRLARARDRLRARLTRRGLTPDGWIESSLMGPATRIEPPARLLEATVAAAIKGMPGAAVTAMAKLMLRGVLMARIKLTVEVLSIVFLMAGFGLAFRGAPASQRRRRPEPARAAVATARSPSAPVDRQGDPLPEHARARLGTTPFHDGSLVNQVLYTPDAKSLVTVNNTPIVHVWDATTGRIVRDIGDPQADLPVITPSRAIALSPDGKTLATVDYPSRLRLWDVATARERRRWREAKDHEYGRPTFSPDGRTVAVSVRRLNETTKQSELLIDLWDTGALTEHRRRIPGDWVRLWDLTFSPDATMLATATRDTEIYHGDTLIGPKTSSTRLWDLATGRERRRFSVDVCDVHAIAFSPDGKLLATAISDGTIRLHDLSTGREREPRLGTQPAIPPGPPRERVPAPRNQPRTISYCLAFSPDGSILAAGTWGSGNHGDSSLAEIHLWDVARGQELRRIPAHQHSVRSLSFSADGRTVASAGGEPVIRLWDVATGREAFAQSGHRSAVRSLTASRADGTLFTGGDDGTIRHWDPSSGQELGLIARLSGRIDALAVAPDGKTLLVVGPMPIQPRQAGWIGIWSVIEHREIGRLAPIFDRNIPQYVAYSPDGKTAASQGRVWDASSGKLLVTLRHQDPRLDGLLSFCPIFYTPDGNHVLTAEPDGVRIWNIAAGREVRRAVLWSNCHDRARLSPDGRFLDTRGPGVHSRGSSDADDWPYRLWELASGEEVATSESHGDLHVRRAFSPDGRFLASAGGDATVRVRDLATGREVRRFAGHRGAVSAIAFVADGRSVISAGEDATALVWDLSDLTDHSTVAPPITPDVFKARWTELAGNDARAAYRATWTLSVSSAVPFLREHLRPAGLPDPEGIPAATGPIAPPDVLRTLRAIAALERVGTPEARAVLERMARGNPDAIETRDAKSALDRPGRRPEAQP